MLAPEVHIGLPRLSRRAILGLGGAVPMAGLLSSCDNPFSGGLEAEFNKNENEQVRRIASQLLDGLVRSGAAPLTIDKFGNRGVGSGGSEIVGEVIRDQRHRTVSFDIENYSGGIEDKFGVPPPTAISLVFSVGEKDRVMEPSGGLSEDGIRGALSSSRTKLVRMNVEYTDREGNRIKSEVDTRKPGSFRQQINGEIKGGPTTKKEAEGDLGTAMSHLLAAVETLGDR